MKTSLIIFSFVIANITNAYSDDCVKNSQELFKSKDYQESIKLINNCLTDAIDSKDKNLMSDLYYGLGINYYNIGYLDSALKYYSLSEYIANEIENSKLKARLNNEIAATYIEQGMNHKALYYLKKSLELNLQLGRQKSITRNYINLGLSFSNLSIIDSSAYYYNKALMMTENKSDLYNLILNNISALYFKQGKLEKSREYINKAMEFNNISETDQFIYKTNLDIYLIADNMLPKYNLVSEYLNYAENNSPLILADANFKASIYKLHDGQMKEALSYLNRAISIYVSNNNINRAKEITGTFIRISNSINKSNITKIEEEYDDLVDKERVQYSNLLLKETDFRIEIEKSIIDLNERLNIATVNIKILIVFILLLVVFIPVAIRYVIINRLMTSLKENLFRFENDLTDIHEKKMKNNIGKMISLMVVSNKFYDDDIFVKTIDEIAEDSNNLSQVINNNKLIRGTNANTTTTNKLPMGR